MNLSKSVIKHCIAVVLTNVFSTIAVVIALLNLTLFIKKSISETKYKCETFSSDIQTAFHVDKLEKSHRMRAYFKKRQII